MKEIKAFAILDKTLDDRRCAILEDYFRKVLFINGHCPTIG